MKLVIGLILLMYSYGHAQVNYYDDVQPIILKHCISCHAEGGIGPIALDSYENVASFANMIEFVTSSKIMPPWRANQDHLDLSISKYLSEGELNVIRNWIEGGLIEGEEKAQVSDAESINEPSSLDTLHSNGDSLENKKVIFKVKEPFTHEGDYDMHQRVFVVPTSFDKDVYVSGVEFIPSNRGIVLGCDIAIDTSRAGRKYDAMDPRSGYANVTGVAFRPKTLSWYGWSPDDVQKPFEGYKILPANCDLLLYIQYAPSANREIDQSEVILTYSETPLQGEEIVSKVLIDTSSLKIPFLITSNSVKQVRAEHEFEEDVLLRAIRPYGQLICETWQVFLLDNNGRSRVLLEIEDWQFKWQRKYKLAKPLVVSQGSKIIAKATYNNTVENIDIPILPTKNVTYGEGMNQELFLVSFDYSKMNKIRDFNY